MEAAVDGSRDNGGLYQWKFLLMEAAVGWRGNDAIALAAMASLADDGSSNGCNILNCPVVVDAAATILSLALTVAAKTPLPPPPLTTAFIGDGCYCSC
jgi:hypothetical protein